MDPEIQTLVVQAGDTAVRHTARSIFDRIKARKAQGEAEGTISELEELINELVDDKNELYRIVKIYEEKLAAQRISETEIEYISNKLIPQVQELMTSVGDSNDEQKNQIADLLKPLLSVETVTVLQLLGFNFLEAIGKPLTELVAQHIAAKAPVDSNAGIELQKLNARLQLAYQETANDPDNFERFNLIIKTFSN